MPTLLSLLKSAALFDPVCPQLAIKRTKSAIPMVVPPLDPPLEVEPPPPPPPPPPPVFPDFRNATPKL